MAVPGKNQTLDHQRFEQLFKEHFAHLCNFAYQFVKDRAAAQDISQKVFLNLWENRASIDLSKAPKSYLFTAVRNRSLNYLRDHQRYRSRVLDLDIHDLDQRKEADEPDLDELRTKIAQALDTLPAKCRQVFEMRRYRGMKYRDIAEELGRSQKTVEAHMSRALRGLREALKDYYLWWWMCWEMDWSLIFC